jgi:hypothetical protein
MVPLVVITDAVLDGLAADPAAAGLPAGLFTALAVTRRKVARLCSRCGKLQAQQALAGHYAALKAAIVAQTPANRALLKQALNAEKVRVVSGRNSQGSEVRWTL